MVKCWIAATFVAATSFVAIPKASANDNTPTPFQPPYGLTIVSEIPQAETAYVYNDGARRWWCTDRHAAQESVCTANGVYPDGYAGFLDGVNAPLGA